MTTGSNFWTQSWTFVVHVATAVTSWIRDVFDRALHSLLRNARYTALDFSLAREEVVISRPLAAFVSPEPAMVGGGAMYRRWR